MLAKLRLLDEYELIVQPTRAVYGPTLFAGQPKPLDLKLISRREFA